MVSVFSLDLMAIILIFSKHICETRHFRPAASIPMMLNPEIMNFIMCGGRGEGGGEIKIYTVSLWSIYQFIFWYEIYSSQRPLQLDSLEGFLTRSVMSFRYAMPVAFFCNLCLQYQQIMFGLQKGYFMIKKSQPCVLGISRAELIKADHARLPLISEFRTFSQQ